MIEVINRWVLAKKFRKQLIDQNVGKVHPAETGWAALLTQIRSLGEDPDPNKFLELLRPNPKGIYHIPNKFTCFSCLRDDLDEVVGAGHGHTLHYFCSQCVFAMMRLIDG